MDDPSDVQWEIPRENRNTQWDDLRLERDEPDRETKSFTLADLEWARREGRENGIKDVLMLIDAGATTAYVREHLLD